MNFLKFSELEAESIISLFYKTFISSPIFFLPGLEMLANFVGLFTGLFPLAGLC
jgi:hypothetical protein